jgi:hypothetical protein
MSVSDAAGFDFETYSVAIGNVDGDMVIEGGLHASAEWQSYQLRSEIDRARLEAAQLSLSPETRSSVDWALGAAAAQATSARPDKCRIAEMLATATEALREAGALATAGTTLVVALRRAAALLGPLGAVLVALL